MIGGLDEIAVIYYCHMLLSYIDEIAVIYSFLRILVEFRFRNPKAP